MKLNDNWRIKYDENNVILENHEIRTRTKKDESEEQYEWVDQFYFPTVKIALKAFVQKGLKGSDSIQDCLSRIDKLEALISRL